MLPSLLAALLAACQTSEEATYYADAKPIIDARCAGCHQDGDIAPFPLTTYDEVIAFSDSVQASIESGTMPPWQPADDCNSYLGNTDLTADEEALLLAWLDAGAPQGDPADEPAPAADTTTSFEADLSLQLPEPYTPTREPDDYHCQLIPWPAEDIRYVTGLRVEPDQRSIVHHVIVFVIAPAQVEQYQAYDEAEEGPGYTCYGGPTAGEGGGLFDQVEPEELLAALDAIGLTVADLESGELTVDEFIALLTELGLEDQVGGFRTLGSWVPGTSSPPYPEGTGIHVEPGSMLVAQVHYNTSTASPVADQSTIELATATTVERQATSMAALDLGWVTHGLVGDPMTIPAGESQVEHSTTVTYDSIFMSSARDQLGMAEGEAMVIYTANHHMHELGTSQRSELQHADGSSTCLLHNPDWDFNWQGAYTLAEPVTVAPGDAIWMGCTWDNSAANQPVVDGEVREPQDVDWGEGTSDEMCLGSYYVTAE